MRYWMNADSGRVVARDCNDVPMGEWFEIDEIDYTEALHPLTQPNTDPQATDCPRCGGRGSVRNDGFVWVQCPICNGTGIAAKT